MKPRSTKYLLEALREEKEFEEDTNEIRVRLYQLDDLVGSVHDLTLALSEAEQITLTPAVLFALSDVFNTLGEIQE